MLNISRPGCLSLEYLSAWNDKWNECSTEKWNEGLYHQHVNLIWRNEVRMTVFLPSLWFRQPCSSSSSMHRLFVKNIMRCSPEMQPLTPEIRGHAVTVCLTMLVNSGFLIESFNFFLVGLVLLYTTEAGCEAVTLFHISDHRSFTGEMQSVLLKL